MRVKIQQFLYGKNHSWSVVGQNVGRALLKRGHEVDFVSTDGVKDEFVPDDLRPHIKENPGKDYDLQFSYTMMKNFPNYLNPAYGGKRAGLWLYEYDVMPKGSVKYVNHVDKFLIASKFFWNVCKENKIPEEKMEMFPHGVDWERFENAIPMPLRTSKTRKILVNFAQPHLRKNVRGTLEAFGRAFTSKDDVAFVLKVKDKKPEQQFEISWKEEFSRFKKRFKNHPECLVLDKFIPKIEDLYAACDILCMLPHCEGFFLPAIEALSANKVVIAPRYGGQLDFLNDENSILVDGKVARADPKAMYWSSSLYASWFKPSVEDAAEKLKYVVDNYNEVHKNIKFPDDEFKKYFSWEHNAEILEGMVNEG